MATKCWSCKRTFEGSSCDYCTARKEAAAQRSALENLEKAQRHIADTQRRIADEGQENVQALLEEQRRVRDAIAAANEEHVRAIREEQEAITEAIEEQTEAIGRSWQRQATTKLQRVTQLYEAGLLEEAETLCEDALAQDPGNLYGHYLCSMIAAAGGRLDRSVKSARKAVALLTGREHRDNPESFAAVARALVASESPDDLFANYRRSLRDNAPELARRSTGQFLRLADTLLAEGLVADGAQLCHSAISLHGGPNPEGLFVLAYLLECVHRSGQAGEEDMASAFVEALPHTSAKEVLYHLKAVERADALSSKVKTSLREAVGRQLNTWAPSIFRDLREEAGKVPLSRDMIAYAFSLGFPAGVAVWALLTVLPAFFLKKAGLLQAVAGWMLLMGIPGAWMGFKVGAAILRQPRRKAFERLVDAEFRQWRESGFQFPRMNADQTVPGPPSHKLSPKRALVGIGLLAAIAFGSYWMLLEGPASRSGISQAPEVVPIRKPTTPSDVGGRPASSSKPSVAPPDAIGQVLLLDDLRIYPSSVLISIPGGAQRADCKGQVSAQSAVSPLLKIARGKWIDVLEIPGGCDDDVAATRVRAQGVTGFALLNVEPASVKILNDEGAFQVLYLERMRCEGDPQCILEHYIEPYVKFLAEYPQSKRSAEAARILAERYSGLADQLEAFIQRPDAAPEWVRLKGDSFLRNQAKVYRGLGAKYAEEGRR